MTTISRSDLPETITDTETPGGRYVTPLGDRRERPVPCSERRVNECERTTFALNAVCDFCAFAKMLSVIGKTTT